MGAQKLDKTSQNSFDIQEFLAGLRFEHRDKLDELPIDEGFEAPASILKLKMLDTPRRLPRPLSAEQVRRLEKSLQTAITEAKTNSKWILAVRDLACFYLLWHCGSRISEVCSLLYLDVDVGGRKLFIRNSKERKDRIVYMSDAVALALQQYLVLLDEPTPI